MTSGGNYSKETKAERIIGDFKHKHPERHNDDYHCAPVFVTQPGKMGRTRDGETAGTGVESTAPRTFGPSAAGPAPAAWNPREGRQENTCRNRCDASVIDTNPQVQEASSTARRLSISYCVCYICHTCGKHVTRVVLRCVTCMCCVR